MAFECGSVLTVCPVATSTIRRCCHQHIPQVPTVIILFRRTSRSISLLFFFRSSSSSLDQLGLAQLVNGILTGVQTAFILARSRRAVGPPGTAVIGCGKSGQPHSSLSKLTAIPRAFSPTASELGGSTASVTAVTLTFLIFAVRSPMHSDSSSSGISHYRSGRLPRAFLPHLVHKCGAYAHHRGSRTQALQSSAWRALLIMTVWIS